MQIYLIFDLMLAYACLILLVQLWTMKIDIVLFLSILILRKRGYFAEIS